MTGRLRLIFLVSAVLLRLYAPSAAATTAYRVYAVVTSFYNTRDTIAWHEVQARWASKEKDLLASDATTLAELRQAFGDSKTISSLKSVEEVYGWLEKHPDSIAIVPFDSLSPRMKVLNVDGIDIFQGIDHYPLAFTSDEPNYNPDHMTTISMSGVTALTRGTGEMLDKLGAAWAVQDILSAFDHSDFRHTSNEVSFAANCLRPGTTQTFGSLCSKDSYFDVIKQVGFNIIELTGNHNNDYGYEAYKRTLQRYKDEAIATFAGGLTDTEAQIPLLVTHHGNTIAFVGCNWAGPKFAWATSSTPGAARCDESWLQTVLKSIKADIKIVSVQYTEYDKPEPVAIHRQRFMALTDFGADVIMGTASHRPQTFSFKGDKFIHYGLGNLFFDQTEIQQKNFFIDRLTVYEGRLINVTLLTGKIEDLARPRLMTAQERDKFLSTMLYLSQYGDYVNNKSSQP
jgi:hypothetical protein